MAERRKRETKTTQADYSNTSVYANDSHLTMRINEQERQQWMTWARLNGTTVAAEIKKAMREIVRTGKHTLD